jgi:centromere protein X
MSERDAENTAAIIASSRGTTGGGSTSRSGGGEDEEPPEKTIPADLLTRILHEFFGKDATRISRDANAAAGKYVYVFTREAIARAAVEKRGGFLEVCHGLTDLI